MLFDAVQNIRLSPDVVTYCNDGDSGMPLICRLWHSAVCALSS